MERILFRVTEVAGFLGLSRAKTYELMKSGALPSVKVDGCRRIKADDPYFQQISHGWGDALKSAFDSLPDISL